MHAARRYDLFAVGLMAAALVAALLLWPALPDRLAIHWSGGTPDSYVSKPVATFGLFALGVVAVAFVRLAPSSMTNTPGGPNRSVAFLGLVFAWVQGIVLVWNTGHRFDVGLAVLPLLVFAGLFALYGRYRSPLG